MKDASGRIYEARKVQNTGQGEDEGRMNIKKDGKQKK